MAKQPFVVSYVTGDKAYLFVYKNGIPGNHNLSLESVIEKLQNYQLKELQKRGILCENMPQKDYSVLRVSLERKFGDISFIPFTIGKH